MTSIAFKLRLIADAIDRGNFNPQSLLLNESPERRGDEFIMFRDGRQEWKQGRIVGTRYALEVLVLNEPEVA